MVFFNQKMPSVSRTGNRGHLTALQHTVGDGTGIDAVQWILGERINTVYAKTSDKIFHDKTIMSLMEDGDLPYSISGFFEEWKQGCRKEP